MSNPWSEVRSALRPDADPDEGEDEAEAVPTAAPGAWGRVAEGLTGGSPAPTSGRAEGTTADEEPAPAAPPPGWKAAEGRLRPARRLPPSDAPGDEEEQAEVDRTSPASRPSAMPSSKARPSSKAGSSSKAGPSSKAGSSSKAGPTSKPGPPSSSSSKARRATAAGTAGERDGADRGKRRPQRTATPVEPEVEGAEDGAGPPPARRLVTRGRALAGGAIVVVAVVVALLLYFLLPSGGLPSGVAMSVEGKNVSVANLNANINVLTHFYGITAPSQSDASAYATYLQTEAKAYAIDLLLEHEAPKYKVSVPASQVNSEFTSLVKNVAGGDQAKLDQLFGQYGLTEAEVRDQIRFQLLDVALYNKVVGSPTVTAAQITKTYNANTQTMAFPETRAISHILVADQATAQSIYTQLTGGANFAQLAAADSLDTNTKSNGGSLGTLAEEQLKPAFAQAAFAAPLNVPFGPVNENTGSSTNNGWDVGLVTAINPAQPAADNAASQAIIRQYLSGVDKNNAWQAWLSTTLAHADIRYAKQYRPANPKQAPATQAPTLRSLVLQAADGQSTSGSGTSTTPPSS